MTEVFGEKTFLKADEQSREARDWTSFQKTPIRCEEDEKLRATFLSAHKHVW